MKSEIMEREDFILQVCRDKCVLHVGCADSPYTETRLADGTLLHCRIENLARVQYGIDIDAAGIGLLRGAGYRNLAVGNVEEVLSAKPFGDVEFDVVVAGEVLEHLSNPGFFLDSLRPLLKSPSALLALTTTNATCAYRFLFAALTGRECVHPDHVSYYSQSTLCRLLRDHGYSVERFAYYPIGREHSKHVKRGARWALWIADRLAYRFAPVLGDGVMVLCKSEPGED